MTGRKLEWVIEDSRERSEAMEAAPKRFAAFEKWFNSQPHLQYTGLLWEDYWDCWDCWCEGAVDAMKQVYEEIDKKERAEC